MNKFILVALIHFLPYLFSSFACAAASSYVGDELTMQLKKSHSTKFGRRRTKKDGKKSKKDSDDVDDEMIVPNLQPTPNIIIETNTAPITAAPVTAIPASVTTPPSMAPPEKENNDVVVITCDNDDGSITIPDDAIDLRVSYIYNIKTEEGEEASKMIRAVETELLQRLKDLSYVNYCSNNEDGNSIQRRRQQRFLNNNVIVGLSALPEDEVSGSCGTDCTSIDGSMTVYYKNYDDDNSDFLLCDFLELVVYSMDKIQAINDFIIEIELVEDENSNCNDDESSILLGAVKPAVVETNSVKTEGNDGDSSISAGTISGIFIIVAMVSVFIAFYIITAKRRTNNDNIDCSYEVSIDEDDDDFSDDLEINKNNDNNKLNFISIVAQNDDDNNNTTKNLMSNEEEEIPAAKEEVTAGSSLLPPPSSLSESKIISETSAANNNDLVPDSSNTTNTSSSSKTDNILTTKSAVVVEKTTIIAEQEDKEEKKEGETIIAAVVSRTDSPSLTKNAASSFKTKSTKDNKTLSNAANKHDEEEEGDVDSVTAVVMGNDSITPPIITNTSLLVLRHPEIYDDDNRSFSSTSLLYNNSITTNNECDDDLLEEENSVNSSDIVVKLFDDDHDQEIEELLQVD